MKDVHKIRMFAAVAGLLVILAAAVFHRQRSLPPRNMPAEGKLSVVASFYPLAYFAERIGGDKSAVLNVTPAGAEPHEYEPSAQDVARMEDSDILIMIGNGLEPWGRSVTSNLDPARTRVVVAGEGLADQRIEEDGKDAVDAHVWLSPPLAVKMADRIADAFVQADPVHAAEFRSNAQALKNDLAALDAAFKKELASCARKDLITSHAAFGYLATAYELRQVPISGLSPDAEPSSKDLIDITDFARKNGVKYIFFESLVSPKLSDTIAAEVGAKTLVLNPIEGLTREELADGKDFLTEMRSNLENLKIALECRS